jgi:hypothetical protein
MSEIILSMASIFPTGEGIELFYMVPNLTVLILRVILLKCFYRRDILLSDISGKIEQAITH